MLLQWAIQYILSILCKTAFPTKNLCRMTSFCQREMQTHNDTFYAKPNLDRVLWSWNLLEYCTISCFVFGISLINGVRVLILYVCKHVCVPGATLLDSTTASWAGPSLPNGRWLWEKEHSQRLINSLWHCERFAIWQFHNRLHFRFSETSRRCWFKYNTSRLLFWEYMKTSFYIYSYLM